MTIIFSVGIDCLTIMSTCLLKVVLCSNYFFSSYAHIEVTEQYKLWLSQKMVTLWI